MFGSLYEKDLEKIKKLIKKKHFMIGKDYDEIAWNAYQADLAVASVTGKIEINKIATKKFNYNTILAYEQDTNNTITQIANATSNASAKSIYSTWFNGTHSQSVQNEIFENVKMAENLLKVKTMVNEQLMLTSINKDGMKPIYTNSFGDQLIDASAVDIDGNSVSINNPDRQALISSYQTKANAQKTNDNNERNRLELQSKDKFTDAYIVMAKNKKINSNYLDSVKNDPYLSPAAKQTFTENYMQLEKSLATDAIDYTETEAGRNTYITLKSLVDTGAINYNNNDEMQLLHNAFINNYIDKTNYDSLVDKAEEVQTTRGQIITKKLNNATKAVARTLGQDSFLDQFQEIAQNNTLQPDEARNAMMALLDSNADFILIFEMANNLEEIVSQAEKEGVNIDNLLSNPAHPSYVIADIVKVYQEEKLNKDRILTTQESDNLIKQYGNFIGLGNEFRIKPSAYIKSLDYKIPDELVAKENETISEYTKRVGRNVQDRFGVKYYPSTLDVSSLAFDEEKE